MIIVVWYTRQKYKNLQINFSKNSTMWITPSISSLSKNDQLKPIDGSVGDFRVNRNSLSFHAENADRLLKEMVKKVFIFRIRSILMTILKTFQAKTEVWLLLLF